MSRRLLAVLPVVLGLSLAGTLSAGDGGGAASDAGADAGAIGLGGMQVRRQRSYPTAPVVRNRVLVYPVRRTDNPYGLDRAMLPGGRTGTRAWTGMPEGGAVYDPTNGYYYSPTALSAVMPVRVTLPDGEARTVYVPYDRSRPVSAVEYRQLVAAAIAYAQAAPADAGGAEETVAPERPAQDEGRRAGPAEPGRRFGSTLSPMLGGGSRVSMLFALGETRLRQGRFGEAVGEFHRNIRSAPNDGASHLALALAFAGVGAYGPAASEARTGLANATDPATLTLDPAAVFGDAGKFDTIRSEVAGALAETPGDADLIVVAGFLAFLGGDYDQAADLLERSRQAGLRDAGVARLLVAAKAMLRAREAAPADAAEPQEGSTEPQ